MHDFTEQQSLYTHTHTGLALPMGTGDRVTQWCSTSSRQFSKLGTVKNTTALYWTIGFLKEKKQFTGSGLL